MRIAIFTESLPPLTDGVARTFTRLAETLNQKGQDFLFFSPSLPPEREPWRDRVIQVPSLPFPLYDYYRVGVPHRSWLDKVLDRFQPDLVQVAAPTPLCFYAQDYARSRGITSVASYHTHFADYLPYYHLSWAKEPLWALMRWFHNRSRMTFAPTPGAAAQLIQRGIRGVQLWPRGIDRQKFSPFFRNAGLRAKMTPRGEPLLLFVGRLVAEKGLGDLVATVKTLREKGREFRLVFAGDGPYGKILRAQLPHDHFLGFVQGHSLSKLYASADLFLFPSPTETFGNVILEAFASGLPVLGVDQGGSADLVQAGVNGLLAKPGDPAGLAALVAEVLDHPEISRRLSQGALETALAYDWTTINGRLLSAYGQLIGRQWEQAGRPRRHRASAQAAARFLNRKFGRRNPSIQKGFAG